MEERLHDSESRASGFAADYDKMSAYADRLTERVDTLATQLELETARANANYQDRKAALARCATLESHLRDADAALARDRTGLAKALGAIVDEVRGRIWVTDDRGCYAWDDDRYKAEAGDALSTVMDIAQTALRESGSLVIPALNAIDAIPGVRVRK